jgi:hypothetical protein
MGGLERAISGLPGIKGYREKEMRRDADKLVRDSLVKRLGEQRTRLTELQSELLNSGGLLFMDDMEKVVTRLNTLMDRIRTASRGYAGFFDIQKVKEDELDRLVAFDRSLFESLPALEEAVTAVGKSMADKEGIEPAIKVVGERLADLNQTFGRRSEAMHEAG